MALTREFLGVPSTNEKYLLKATTDNVNVTSVILTISVDGVNVFSIEHLPDIGTSDEFSFNISEIIKEYYETTFFDLSLDELTAESFNTKRIVAVTEEVIGLVPVGVGYNDNIFIDKFYIELLKESAFNFTTYNVGDSGSSTRKFLSNSPSPQELKYGESLFLAIKDFSIDGSNLAKQEVIVERYNSSDVLLSTITVDLTVKEFTPSFFKGFNNYFRVEMPTGVSYLLVYVKDVVGATKRSEVRRINYNCSEGVRVHWINEFNCQDSYTFKGRIVKGIATNSKAYQKVRAVAPTTVDVGNLIYSNDIANEWEIWTNTISPTDFEWLKSMFYSKRIALEIDGNYYPIILSENDFVYNDDFDSLTQFSIPFTFANVKNNRI